HAQREFEARVVVAALKEPDGLRIDADFLRQGLAAHADLRAKNRYSVVYAFTHARYIADSLCKHNIPATRGTRRRFPTRRAPCRQGAWPRFRRFSCFVRPSVVSSAGLRSFPQDSVNGVNTLHRPGIRVERIDWHRGDDASCPQARRNAH